MIHMPIINLDFGVHVFRYNKANNCLCSSFVCYPLFLSAKYSGTTYLFLSFVASYSQFVCKHCMETKTLSVVFGVH